VGALEQVQRQLSHGIESLTGLRMSVRLVQPQTIPRSEGKARRVVDKRKM
jgi:phenylacetate-CoA ligase